MSEPYVGARPCTSVRQSNELQAAGSPHNRFEVKKLEIGRLPKIVDFRYISLQFRAKPKYRKMMSTTKTVLGVDDMSVEVIDCGPSPVRLGSAKKDLPRESLLLAVNIRASLPKGGSDVVQLKNSVSSKNMFSPCIDVCCTQCTVYSTVLVERYIPEYTPDLEIGAATVQSGEVWVAHVRQPR